MVLYFAVAVGICSSLVVDATKCTTNAGQPAAFEDGVTGTGSLTTTLEAGLLLALLALVVAVTGTDLGAADFANLHDSSPGGGLSDTYLWQENIGELIGPQILIDFVSLLDA